jgi:hypothetical protein
LRQFWAISQKCFQTCKINKRQINTLCQYINDKLVFNTETISENSNIYHTNTQQQLLKIVITSLSQIFLSPSEDIRRNWVLFVSE